MELLVAISLLGLTVAMTLGYLLPLRQRAGLQQDMDQLTRFLELSRQQSVAAHRGQAYGVEIIEGTNVIYLLPFGSERQLSSQTRLTIEGDSNEIVFSRLTGALDQDYTISLRNRGLLGQVMVSQTGLITQETIHRE